MLTGTNMSGKAISSYAPGEHVLILCQSFLPYGLSLLHTIVELYAGLCIWLLKARISSKIVINAGYVPDTLDCETFL